MNRTNRVNSHRQYQLKIAERERLALTVQRIRQRLAARAGGGFDVMTPRGRLGPLLRYAVPAQTNLDSNTVDMDRERASFVDNAVKYEATLRFINGSVRTLLSAITGQ